MEQTANNTIASHQTQETTPSYKIIQIEEIIKAMNDVKAKIEKFNCEAYKEMHSQKILIDFKKFNFPITDKAIESFENIFTRIILNAIDKSRRRKAEKVFAIDTFLI